MSIRILLADDHKMVRKGLQLFLASQKDIRFVGEASSGEEAIARTAELAPDIVLMDIMMPGIGGIEATALLAERHPAVKVIILSSSSDENHALPAIRAGAKGYLLKDIEPEELAAAIRRVHEGKVELHPDIAGQLMNQYVSHYQGEGMRTSGETAPHESLTPRELDVLRLIAAGRSNRGIADELVITEKTVKTHVSHILAKLDVADRTQAALYAVKHGLDRAAPASD
ncbi:response regulator transcription factor [Paenibacillus sp. LHD-117]|uniref:response regulator transcription factor n=1 Tax=Paenibacillus sp. LHD-117 TaxID=3071412 RepID=UPI0027E189B2|nr:response regulator transcription factor [Paenibacillus sp. LHD-117]MDQ6418746.1 response regulator transcription factor [Paenibacillus sp. LHD-117]